jgi:hypothetical protein
MHMASSRGGAWHFKEWTRAEASTCDPLKICILDHCCPRTISNCVFVLNHLCTVKFRENFRIHDAKKIPMDTLDTLRNTGIHAFVSPKYGKRLGYARYRIRVRGLEFEVGNIFLLRQLTGFLIHQKQQAC